MKRVGENEKGDRGGRTVRRGSTENEGGGNAEVEKTTTAVALPIPFLAAIIERASGISKVKIKIKMRCRG